MKKFLKKKIVVKQTIGRSLFNAVMSSLGVAVGFFVVLNFYNSDIIWLLNLIETGEITAIQFFLFFLLPVSLILGLTLKLGIIVMKKEYK